MSDRTYMKKARRNRTTAGSLSGPYMDIAPEQKLRMRRARRRVDKEIIKDELKNMSPLHNE